MCFYILLLQAIGAERNEKRVAVCVVGQLRCTFCKAFEVTRMMHANVKNYDALRVSSLSAPWSSNKTLVELLHDRFFEPLSKSGSAYDVFVVTHAENFPNKETAICEAFRPSDINNKLYCAISNDTLDPPLLPLMHKYIVQHEERLPRLKKLRSVQLQLLDLSVCNAMRRSVEQSYNVQYDYMIRARPETVFFEEFPRDWRTRTWSNAGPKAHLPPPIRPVPNGIEYTSKAWHSSDQPDNKTLIYGTTDYTCCGNVDTFGIVPRPLFDCYFDRYYRLTTPSVTREKSLIAHALQHAWDAEAFCRFAVADCGGRVFETRDIFSHRGGEAPNGANIKAYFE